MVVPHTTETVRTDHREHGMQPKTRDTMMTRRAKRRDWCCPGHNPKTLSHGTSRAREKREWQRGTQQDDN